jgi:hypothetical protein
MVMKVLKRQERRSGIVEALTFANGNGHGNEHEFRHEFPGKGETRANGF